MYVICIFHSNCIKCVFFSLQSLIVGRLTVVTFMLSKRTINLSEAQSARSYVLLGKKGLLIILSVFFVIINYSLYSPILLILAWM